MCQSASFPDDLDKVKPERAERVRLCSVYVCVPSEKKLKEKRANSERKIERKTC